MLFLPFKVLITEREVKKPDKYTPWPSNLLSYIEFLPEEIAYFVVLREDAEICEQHSRQVQFCRYFKPQPASDKHKRPRFRKRPFSRNPMIIFLPIDK